MLVAKANKDNLSKARETAAFRLQHYLDLLGNEDFTIPDAPTIDATLTADSQLPADTSIAEVETDVDASLSDESCVKLITREKEELDKTATALTWQDTASALEGIAGTLHLIPTFAVDVKPFGIGAGADFGGAQLGAAASAFGQDS